MLSNQTLQSVSTGLRWATPILLVLLVIYTAAKIYLPGWSLYGAGPEMSFNGGVWDLVTVLVRAMFSKEFWFIAGIYVVALAIDPSPRTLPQTAASLLRAGVRDWAYFLISIPLLLVVFHEAVICMLVPGIGIAAGDSGGCTLGWLLLPIFPVAAVWLLLSLFIALPRLDQFYLLRKEAPLLLAAYLFCFLIPLGFLLFTLYIH